MRYDSIHDSGDYMAASISKRDTGFLLILSGPSGVGKDTVANALRKRYSFSCPKSYTTRSPRQMPDDTNYIFVTESEFDNRVPDMIAVTKSHGKRYGISRSELERDLRSGSNIIKVIDISGADEMKTLYGNACLTIFLLPPSIDVLMERLSKRGSEDDETFRRRMADSIREISVFNEHMFDESVTVYDTHQAVDAISNLINSQLLLD